MTDMIERVARAIAHSLHEPPDAWVHWQAEAHAAIAAMRTPTVVMIAAGKMRWHEPAFYGEPRVPYLEDAGAVVWERAIDAALGER